MLNKVVLIGRLTKDPENRSTQGGTSVTTFTLAVDRNYINQSGERETDFLPVVTFKGLADTCYRYLEKGRLVAVSGRIQTRSYEGNDGKRRYVTEIIADEINFLERKQENSQQGSKTAPAGFEPVYNDSELPF
jgi:single-strand DNA-binding protein